MFWCFATLGLGILRGLRRAGVPGVVLPLMGRSPWRGAVAQGTPRAATAACGFVGAHNNLRHDRRLRTRRIARGRGTEDGV